MTRGHAAPIAAVLFAMSLGGCDRGCGGGTAEPQLPAPPPIVRTLPMPIPVPDAGADAADAGPDAGDAGTDARPAPVKRVRRAKEAGGEGASVPFRVEGPLPRADAERVVHGAASRLRDCFNKQKDKDPRLVGKVVFRLTANDRGRVTLGEVVKTTLDGGDEAETCMIHVARDLKFPAAGGESIVTFQMSFGGARR